MEDDRVIDFTEHWRDRGRLPYRRPDVPFGPDWIRDDRYMTIMENQTNIFNNFLDLPEGTLLYISRSEREDDGNDAVHIMGFVSGEVDLSTEGFARFNIDPIRVDRGRFDLRGRENNLIHIDSEKDTVSLHPLVGEHYLTLDQPPGVPPIDTPLRYLPGGMSGSYSGSSRGSSHRSLGSFGDQSHISPDRTSHRSLGSFGDQSHISPDRTSHRSLGSFGDQSHISPDRTSHRSLGAFHSHDGYGSGSVISASDSTTGSSIGSSIDSLIDPTIYPEPPPPPPPPPPLPQRGGGRRHETRKNKKSRGRKSRGRKSRGRKSRGRKSRGRKSRGRKSCGRKSCGRKSRGRKK
jgi:hypothetical protein